MPDSVLSLVILLPLLGSALIGLTGFMMPGFRKQEKLIGTIGTFAVAIPFFIYLSVYLNFSHTGAVDFTIIDWMVAGNLDIKFSYRIDELSLLMGMIVTGVGSLIHMYSIGYMHGDRSFYKYFAYLNLFIFAMSNLIVGDNIVVLFLGWEGVGVCSYLLIGFWYEDMSKAMAAQKAFIANRIGDFAMLVAMFIIFAELGTEVTGLTFQEILAHNFSESQTFWITLLVFIAATGKSAQIPLYVWLPDAMAGPTPVSALIHAATMVTSGIYLIVRLGGLFLMSPTVSMIIVVVAAATALLAALMAIAQNDIKGVLAYSTVSQLGFMFMALGAGAYTTAIFHVMTHAFFKACLFLGSGSVIHAMEHTHAVKDPQDIRTMGGLSKYMPHTSRTFWISTLAISGIPLFSGFFSKDEILASLFFTEAGFGVYQVVWFVAVITAFLTAFYMTRVTYLTFNGKERFDAHHHPPHESPALMTIPLYALATLAIVGGLVGIPYVVGHGQYHQLNKWLTEAHVVHVDEGTTGHEGHDHSSHEGHDHSSHEGHDHADHGEHHDEGHGAHYAHGDHGGGLIVTKHSIHENATPTKEWILMLLSTVIAILSVMMARNLYRKHDLAGDEKVKGIFGGLYPVMQNKFYVDELYDKVIINPFVWAGKHIVLAFDQKVVDGLVNGSATFVKNTGEMFRKLQTGVVQNYVWITSVGVLIIMTYLIFG